MARSLFDPDRMQGPPKGGRPLTVSEVAALIAGVLRDHVPATVRVIGEISGFNDRTHWYLRLKDGEAVLDCVMFASDARRVRFEPADGQEVVLTGRIEHYTRQGRTQLYARTMEPAGKGALEAEFRRLVEEIRALGWFDEGRKRRLPLLPRRVAVMTSKTGAALQDVLDTMKRRCPAVEIALVDVHVQGEGAAQEIAGAIRWLSREHSTHGIDAVLLTRGGGSSEDLWAFNEKILAKAIVQSAVPVVCAIGHETDTTIAELVSDLRCATPTQAAMRLAPDRAALAQQIDQRAGAMARAQRTLTERAGESVSSRLSRLDGAARAALGERLVAIERLRAELARVRPDAVLARRSATVEGLAARLGDTMGTLVENGRDAIDSLALHLAIRETVERRAARIATLERELVLASPQSVLGRGYSITLDDSGSVIRSTRDIARGDRVTTRLSDSSFESEVTSSRAGGDRLPGPTKAPARRAPRRARPRRGGGQMDLF